MIYEFGRFRLDTSARTLTRDGAVVPLFPKVFDTLTALVESAGEPLSKDELMRRVWPDTFVQESNLTQNIFILRKALGGEEDQTWIETVPRRGYRFVPAVRLIEEARPAPLASAPSRRAVAAVVLVLLAGAAFAVSRLLKPEDPSPPRAASPKLPSIARLTHDSRAWDPAISRDGKLVAYKAVEGNRSSIWLRDLARGSVVRIMPPSAEDYRSIAFSPDASEIYYRNFPPGVRNGALQRVPIFGGRPVEIARDLWSDFALSPDGREVAFLRGGAGNGVQVVAARVDGSGERTIGVNGAAAWFELWETSPAWSPDGTRLAICGGVHDAGGDRPALFEMDAASGATREIAIPSDWADVSQVLWLDGRALIVAAAADDASPTQLFRLDAGSGTASPVTNDVSDYRKIRLSADARLLVAEQQLRDDHVWIVPDGDAARARQVTFGTGDGDGYSGLEWTPDGRLLVVSDRSGEYEIWSMDANGGDARQLTTPSGRANAWPAMTAGGRFIVFASQRGGRWNIWRMDADGRNPVQLTRGASETKPSVSPDGRMVYYVNTAKTPASIERVSIDGGEPERVELPGSVSSPAISPDGTMLAFYSYDERRGWHNAIVPVAGGRPRVFDWHSTRGIVRWSRDSQALYYIDHSAVRLQPLRGGPARPVAAFEDTLIWNFDVAPNGRDLAVVHGHLLSDIVLIRDFR